MNIINIYAPNIIAPKHMRKVSQDFKKDIDSNTPILGDFNTPLSKLDRFSKQNINKDIAALNNVLDQMVVTDIHIKSYIPKKQDAYSFQMYMAFLNIHHMI